MQILNIGSQPPKKKITINTHIIKIFEYSAKKNRTKVVAAYSTLYPDTNSDSASGKSNGTLLVSAKAEIKNKKKLTNNGNINQILAWNKTISLKFNEPTHNKTLITIIPIDTS